MLATFRSTRVSSMSCELNEQSASLKVTLRCDNGEHRVTPAAAAAVHIATPQDCCMGVCVWLWLTSSLSGWLAGWVVGCRSVEALWSGHQQHRHPAGQPGRLRAAGVSGGRGVRAQQVSPLTFPPLTSWPVSRRKCTPASASGPVAAVCAASILHVGRRPILYHKQQAVLLQAYSTTPQPFPHSHPHTGDTHRDTHHSHVVSLCVHNHNHTAPPPTSTAGCSTPSNPRWTRCPSSRCQHTRPQPPQAEARRQQHSAVSSCRAFMTQLRVSSRTPFVPAGDAGL